MILVMTSTERKECVELAERVQKEATELLEALDVNAVHDPGHVETMAQSLDAIIKDWQEMRKKHLTP